VVSPSRIGKIVEEKGIYFPRKRLGHARLGYDVIFKVALQQTVAPGLSRKFDERVNTVDAP
jgi:hypothetical protein